MQKVYYNAEIYHSVTTWEWLRAYRVPTCVHCAEHVGPVTAETQTAVSLSES